jgi:hypothetical protein
MATIKQPQRGRSTPPAATLPIETPPVETPAGPLEPAFIDAKPSGKYVVQPTNAAEDPSIFGEFLLDTTHPYMRACRAVRNPEPTHRQLRIYTLDPELSKLDGAITTARVPYEPLLPGPVGHLFTVDLYDEVQRTHYVPADLDDRFLLAQDGREPSPSDPMFHAQMVYAVASLTYQHFREALGRHLNWGSRRAAERGGKIVLRPFGSGDRNA